MPFDVDEDNVLHFWSSVENGGRLATTLRDTDLLVQVKRKRKHYGVFGE
jgi:hypothetical protein